MFAIDRSRGGTEEIPEEKIDMAGTTGNIYSVTIGQIPSCTCPDSQKGSQCKHIVYVMHNVLKAPEHLQYQLAFLSSGKRSSLQHPHPLHRKPHQKIPRTAKKCQETARFASPSLSPKMKRLCGAKLRVGIIFTRLASNSGLRVRLGRKYDVFTVEHRGRETRTRSIELRMLADT